MDNRVREGYGALSKDTELLTPTGWLNIAEVTKETLVAQYWKDGQITFGYPTFIRVEKVEKAVHIYNKQRHYDQLVGIYHAIPHIVIWSDCLKIRSANKVGNDSRKRYLNTGVLSSRTTTTLSPLDRIKIAFQADGTIRYRSEKTERVRFAFNKNRKIQRLHCLLSENNIDYKTCHTKAGYVEFYYSAPLDTYEKYFNWVDLSKVNANWCRDFIEEISHWDASIPKSEYFRCTYFNTRKLSVDKVQAIATLAGYRTNIHVEKRDSIKWCTLYVVNIFNGRKSTQGGVITTEMIDYCDVMYHIVVESNMLVMRRNNAVSITGCGNCDLRLPKDQIINTHCGHLT